MLDVRYLKIPHLQLIFGNFAKKLYFSSIACGISTQKWHVMVKLFWCEIFFIWTISTIQVQKGILSRIFV